MGLVWKRHSNSQGLFNNLKMWYAKNDTGFICEVNKKKGEWKYNVILGGVFCYDNVAYTLFGAKRIALKLRRYYRARK